MILSENLDIKTCPHCGVNSPNMHRNQNYENTGAYGKRFWAAYSCKRCGGMVIAEAIKFENTVKKYYPSTRTISEDIPSKAKTFLEQALATIHAPTASILVSNSAIDEMLKQKGLVQGSLYNRINEAAQNHLITDEMAKWAHEVRLDSNDQRHADVNAGLPTEDDAKKCLDFALALALAEFLFVLPARVTRGISGTTPTI